MSYEIEGKLIVKGDIIEVSDKFRKREFVIEKSEQGGNGQTFTDKIKFQLTQKNCGAIDGNNVGDNVKVTFNIKGTEWNKDGKTSYFTNLDAWKIEKVNSDGSSTEGESTRVDPLAGIKIEEGTEDDFFNDSDSSASSDSDDLPF